MRTANKIFFSNKLNIRPCFKENLKKEIELIDYHTNVQRAQNYINNWVSEVTEGEIKDIVKGLSPHSTTTLVST